MSRKSGVCKSTSETMATSDGLLEPAFSTLRKKRTAASRVVLPVFGGFQRAAPLPREPPQEAREVCWAGP